VFVGIKMLLDPHDKPPKWYQADIPVTVSLSLVVGIILTSIIASIIAARREQRKKPPEK
jgi:predicted tellurium resistance membrane protein TerC